MMQMSSREFDGEKREADTNTELFDTEIHI